MSNYKAGFLFLIALVILIVRFFFFYSQKSEYNNGQEVSFQTTLLSDTKISGRYQHITANLGDGNRVYITAAAYPRFSYGDRLLIKGKIKLFFPHNFSRDNSQVITNKNVLLTMFFPKIEAVQNNEKNGFFVGKFLLAVAKYIRQNMVSLAQDSLPPTYSSLLLGIVFGIKSTLSKDFLESLRTTGVLHVVAASGMNVTLVGSFISSFFMIFTRRQFALCATGLAIFLYALIAGFEPSIVRASIMGILVFAGQILGRQTLGAYCLGLAFCGMLFVSPNLLQDVGFQLSFASTLGLLYLKPLFDFRDTQEGSFLKTLVLKSEIQTTLAAQIATFPLILANFGAYSLISLVVNALLLWTIPFIMIFGGVGSILGLITAEAGRFIISLSLPFLYYFEFIVGIFSRFQLGLQTYDFQWQFFVSYYLLLIAVVVLFRFKKQSIAFQKGGA